MRLDRLVRDSRSQSVVALGHLLPKLTEEANLADGEPVSTRLKSTLVNDGCSGGLATDVDDQRGTGDYE